MGATNGVEVSASIHSMAATGESDPTGSREYDFGLTVRPAGGPPYEATTRQYIHPAASFDAIKGAAAGKSTCATARDAFTQCAASAASAGGLAESTALNACQAAADQTVAALKAAK